ncbi:MAG: hypothetical protein KBG48_30555 [Kofleriaceae bacterium]|jgi:hypothetical protein|nr:hypothetical protein [Kofleriaceae bacterium]MBP9171773.1 hypothetical protein [Kofleriaceae bacterium]MBP9856370.1 hypothetical protein [Kofleriaceae bacterium]
MAARSGRLVVAIALALAFGLGGLGSWWLVRSRPTPGAFVDAIATPDGGAVLLRRERGDRYFLEVHGPDRLRWRALVPRYAGAVGTPAIAATTSVVTVRIVRDGRPQLFAFDTARGSKLASFELLEDAVSDRAGYTAAGRSTTFAGGWSAEVLARPDGTARLIAVELDAQRLAWKVEVAAWPDAVWLADGQLVARTGATLAAWTLADGAPTSPMSTTPPSTAPGLVIADRVVTWGGARYAAPADAVAPQPYHAAGDRVWIVEPSRVTALDRQLAVVRTIAR